MTYGKLEHANISVSDPARSAALMKELFGWTIRWEGASSLGGYTVHVGSPDDYIALYHHQDVINANAPFSKGAPMNHIGIVVENLEETEGKVADAGLVPFGHDDYDPGKRFYFVDWDGIEFEVISYS